MEERGHALEKQLRESAHGKVDAVDAFKPEALLETGNELGCVSAAGGTGC